MPHHIVAHSAHTLTLAPCRNLHNPHSDSSTSIMAGKAPNANDIGKFLDSLQQEDEADGTILTLQASGKQVVQVDAIKGAMIQTVSIIGVSVVQRERPLDDGELSRALADVYGVTNYRWIANDLTDPEFNGNRSNLSSFQFEVDPTLFTPQSQTKCISPWGIECVTEASLRAGEHPRIATILCSLTVVRFNVLPRGVSYDDPAGLAIVAGHVATQFGRAARADSRLHMALGLTPDQGAQLKKSRRWAPSS